MCLALNALQDHLLDTGLATNLCLDLVAVPGGDFSAPSVRAVILINPASGGVRHELMTRLGDSEV